ncbi:alpha/beta fold hydrolase [Aeromicrobium sp.]|uniref:alpha/beta fold hydrolase n=1 Tax=Aeromicrobium sp. TaxID=1871063 RepID=UPI002FCC6FCF
MPSIATTHGLVSYRDSGTGVPVVMLHATLHDRRDFDPIFDEIARNHRAIALDWPHHGESSNSGALPRATDLVVTLKDVVNALDLEQAIFIGNSVGGYAAARLAIDDPELVAGLVLVNAGGFTKQTPATKAFIKLMSSPAFFTKRMLPLLTKAYMRAKTDSDKAIITRVKARAAGSGAAVAATLWSSFADPAFDLRAAAAKITAPTLLMWGTKDLTTPLSDGKRAAAVIPNATLHEFPTGHLPFSSQPWEFLEILMPFIDDPA